MTASEAFADDLGSRTEIVCALDAAEVRYVAVQVLVRGSGLINRVRGFGKRCLDRVGAGLAAAEGNRGKKVDWEDGG